MAIERSCRTAVIAVAVVGLAVVTGACGTSSRGQATGTSGSAAPTTAVSTEVAGTAPTGDLALLGPVHSVRVGDIDVGYRRFGSGPPLVMVVGQDSSMSYWGPDLPRRLADRFTVTIFDNRGVGFTSDPRDGPLTIGQMADDTAGLIDALGLDHPTLFGWSTGGEIALALAVRHPGQLGPIVVSGATAGGPDATQAPPELDALMTSSDPVAQVKLLDELFTPSGAAARDAYVKGLLAMPDDPVSAEAEQRQADAEAAFVLDRQVADGLGSIASPVLVTDGADDRLVPTANATFIADRVPGARLLLVPDASHAWMLQDLDRFVATLSAFSAGQPLP
ncbi:MAG: alpha/beta fold hydrolase [Acidimicrobiales bacterium]